MSACIFCQIAKGESPAYKIYEDDNILAFLDIYPLGEGHTQIIPKIHITHVWDMADPGALFNVAAKIANHYREVLKVPNCYSLLLEEWMPHAHLQIIPATLKNQQAFKPAIKNLRQPKINREFALTLQQQIKLT